MNLSPLHILLADDDKDDVILFADALAELPLVTTLTVVNDGEKLMKVLKEIEQLPEFIFLDLNMPRKNGFECLMEIKSNARLAVLPVTIYSTSFDDEVVQRLKAAGAQHYICKPSEFKLLKGMIHTALSTTPSSDNFVIQLNDSSSHE